MRPHTASYGVLPLTVVSALPQKIASTRIYGKGISKFWRSHESHRRIPQHISTSFYEGSMFARRANAQGDAEAFAIFGRNGGLSISPSQMSSAGTPWTPTHDS